MSSPYPDEALDYPVMSLAEIIRHELDDALISNDASETHGLYALALALVWRLQSSPLTERAVLCEGLTGLIRVNALELGERALIHFDPAESMRPNAFAPAGRAVMATAWASLVALALEGLGEQIIDKLLVSYGNVYILGARYTSRPCHADQYRN